MVACFFLFAHWFDLMRTSKKPIASMSSHDDMLTYKCCSRVFYVYLAQLQLDMGKKVGQVTQADDTILTHMNCLVQSFLTCSVYKELGLGAEGREGKGQGPRTGGGGGGWRPGGGGWGAGREGMGREQGERQGARAGRESRKGGQEWRAACLLMGKVVTPRYRFFMMS